MGRFHDSSSALFSVVGNLWWWIAMATPSGEHFDLCGEAQGNVSLLAFGQSGQITLSPEFSHDLDPTQTLNHDPSTSAKKKKEKIGFLPQ